MHVYCTRTTVRLYGSASLVLPGYCAQEEPISSCPVRFILRNSSVPTHKICVYFETPAPLSLSTAQYHSKVFVFTFAQNRADNALLAPPPDLLPMPPCPRAGTVANANAGGSNFFFDLQKSRLYPGTGTGGVRCSAVPLD